MYTIWKKLKCIKCGREFLIEDGKIKDCPECNTDKYVIDGGIFTP